MTIELVEVPLGLEIMVFNPQSLGDVNPEDLRKSLLNVHFDTLCRQYGLNPALVDSATRDLNVITSKPAARPYFLVEYGDENGHPLVIIEWDLGSPRGQRIVNALYKGNASENLFTPINAVNFLVEIELSQHQLSNMGLLLAYEIARWAAVKGGGIVLGLDRTWYRLNHHKAFLPLE